MTDWTPPHTFVNGQEADAADVNATTNSLAEHLNTTGVHVYQAATIETAALEDSAVTAAKLAADAVTTVKILDANVTTAKIADLAVTAAKVAADVATQAELDAHINDTSAAHAATAISADSTTLVGTGTTVQAVFEELDNAIVAAETATAAHLADTTDAHDASAISAVSTTLVGVATDVQGVLEELDNGIADHLSDTTAAHAATAISVDSTNLAGTSITVQGSLEELDDAIAAVVAGGVAAGTITSSHIEDGTIVNADVSDTAEIAVSKLADGAAYDVLQTNSDGATVAWVSGLTSNHLASNSVTTAKITDANVTPVKLAKPEVGRAYLSTDPSPLSSGGTVLSAAAYGWTQAITPTGNFVGWDATNRRYYAVVAGLYEVSAALYLTGFTTSPGDAELELNINTNLLDVAGIHDFSADTVKLHIPPIVVSLSINDYIALESKYSSSNYHVVSGTGVTYGTWIQMKYLGPAT